MMSCFASLTIRLALWKELGSKRKQEKEKKGKIRLAGQIRPVQCGKRVVDSRSWICCGVTSSLCA